MIHFVSVTSKDLKGHQRIKLNKSVANADSTVNHTSNKKGKLKDGSMHEIDEINDEYLDEILHNNNLWECTNVLCLFYIQ